MARLGQSDPDRARAAQAAIELEVRQRKEFEAQVHYVRQLVEGKNISRGLERIKYKAMFPADQVEAPPDFDKTEKFFDDLVAEMDLRRLDTSTDKVADKGLGLIQRAVREETGKLREQGFVIPTPEQTKAIQAYVEGKSEDEKILRGLRTMETEGEMPRASKDVAVAKFFIARRGLGNRTLMADDYHRLRIDVQNRISQREQELRTIGIHAPDSQMDV